MPNEGAVVNEEVLIELTRSLAEIKENQRAIMKAMIVHAKYLTVREELTEILQKRLDQER